MICIWSSWCHCHPIISCTSKIQNGLPFWCRRITQVDLEKRPLDRCSSSSNSSVDRIWFAEWHHQWLNVGNHMRRDFAVIPFFFVAAGAYNRSFYGLLGVEAVNIFRSVNYTVLISISRQLFFQQLCWVAESLWQFVSLSSWGGLFLNHTYFMG